MYQYNNIQPPQQQIVYAEPQPHPKWWIPIIGSLITVVLVIIGIFIHINTKPTTISGQTLAEVQAELDSVTLKLESAIIEEDFYFTIEGFSEKTFAAAAEANELKFRQDELNNNIQSLTDAERNQTIFTTNAALLFFGAIIALPATIIIFLRSRR